MTLGSIIFTLCNKTFVYFFLLTLYYVKLNNICDLIKQKNGVVEPLSVMVGMGVILNWITSLSIYISTMFKLRKEVEERQIYLKNLQKNNCDIAKDRNAHYHQYIIESEVNANRTVKFMMIAFTFGFFPCKYNLKLFLKSLWNLFFLCNNFYRTLCYFKFLIGRRDQI